MHPRNNYKISIIAAMSNGRVIGYQNKLPWHLSADLQRVKKITMGKPIVMGRKTFESIGKPLPGRINIILTRDQNFSAPGCEVVHSIEEILNRASDHSEIMIFGGAEIFAKFLPMVTKMYLTFIHHDFAGDTFFPEWNSDEWQETEHEDFLPDEKNPYHYSFVTLKRKI